MKLFAKITRDAKKNCNSPLKKGDIFPAIVHGSLKKKDRLNKVLVSSVDNDMLVINNQLMALHKECKDDAWASFHKHKPVFKFINKRGDEISWNKAVKILNK